MHWAIIIIFSDESGFAISECQSMCPQACQLKSYGTSLSYASLSAINMDSRLLKNLTNLQTKYHYALDMQQVGKSLQFVLFSCLFYMPHTM